MKPRALKFVPHRKIEDHFRQGWVILIPKWATHHDTYGVEMAFICDCPIKFTEPDEEWRDIPCYEGEYQVSNIGNVRSLDRILSKPNAVRGYPRAVKGKVLRPGNTNGYLAVSLSGEQHYVHHLVALAFIGPRPEGLEVCHNNGIKSHNFQENLRYDTPVGNAADKCLHGTARFGESISHLKEDEVREIRRRATFQPQREIAADFGISVNAVSQIIKRRRWGHLPLHAGECGTPEGDATQKANADARRSKWAAELGRRSRGGWGHNTKSKHQPKETA